jgi:hypothetical protein
MTQFWSSSQSKGLGPREKRDSRPPPKLILQPKAALTPRHQERLYPALSTVDLNIPRNLNSPCNPHKVLAVTLLTWSVPIRVRERQPLGRGRSQACAQTALPSPSQTRSPLLLSQQVLLPESQAYADSGNKSSTEFLSTNTLSLYTQ